jgi:hypothetical protein
MLEEAEEEIRDGCTGCRRFCQGKISSTRWVIFRGSELAMGDSGFGAGNWRGVWTREFGRACWRVEG